MFPSGYTNSVSEVRIRSQHRLGRLLTQPHEPTRRFTPGEQEINLGTGTRQAVIFVPKSCSNEQRSALMLCLHGAGGSCRHRIDPLRPLAIRYGIVLVGVDSLGPTWDLLMSGYGSDVARIDRALEFTFDHCAIDRRRVAIEGFSDGASYALSLGMTNGDLFQWIFAFSPGFMAPAAVKGHPKIYVTHGTFDPTLPVRCSRDTIVPKLRGTGYDVDYREFKGFHMVPKWAINHATSLLAA
jgi:predicted esterase